MRLKFGKKNDVKGKKIIIKREVVACGCPHFKPFYVLGMRGIINDKTIS